MIDLGLSKLAIIGAVALIVIGPKELPKVARMAGTLFGRAQRYINQVKSEVSREIELDELRKIQKEAESAAQDFGNSIKKEMDHVEDEIQSISSYGDNYGYQQHPTTEAFAEKAKHFRQKKLAKTSNIPSWYKNRHGHRSHVISGSARMARHRVKPQSSSSFY
jgi:sec-independent protein translocase protein TatB